MNICVCVSLGKQDFLPIVDIDGTEEDETATEIVKPISEEQKELIEVTGSYH